MTELLYVFPIPKAIGPYSGGIIEFDGEERVAFLKKAVEQSTVVVLVPTERSDSPVEEGMTGVKAEIEQVFSPFTREAKASVKTGGLCRIVAVAEGEAGVLQAEVEPATYRVKCGADRLRALFDRAEIAYNEYLEVTERPRHTFNLPTVNEDMNEIVRSLPTCDGLRFFRTLDTGERLTMFIAALEQGVERYMIDESVSRTVKEAIDANNREYYVREQIKALSAEIDEDDESEEYYEKIDALKASDEIKDKLRREVRRLKRTAPASPEMAIIKNYLDVALELPWGVYTDDNEDLKEAMRVLNEDHYGLDKVKERLIEALAVRKLSKAGRSPILCLVGPPGIGKTSIAKSIARAMNKKYVRLSFGGVRDEAEIRGHRKTYIGSMPGRIVTGIKTAGSMNPVFLMDEIDKMASDYKGDPASALLEVLDPEQNAHFRDHFLELPFDLSKVLFITTANTLETISRPLLDRMEVIEMTGYTDDEKVEIAKRHLIPKAIAQNGIDAAWVTISEEAIRRMITDYTRESGVRGLGKEINEVMRKVARRFVENSDAKPLHLTKGNLKRMLGEPKFRTDKIETTDRVGVVKGLAWTSVGGDTLDVEVALPQGKGELRLTGNLGDVMKESAQIALSYCRTYSDELQIEDGFFKTHDVHIHVPEGAVPKDGPSAGVTIATALASALTGAAVDHTVAMTGELTLRGKVLPIGGLKEKTLAAVRAGVKKVFLPDDNRSDYHELPASLRHAVEFRFVRDVSSIFREALHRAN